MLIHLDKVTSCHRSSCANNGKGALNTPDDYTPCYILISMRFTQTNADNAGAGGPPQPGAQAPQVTISKA
eukprot:9490847-Pyramimonas_sp.AAC.2